MALGEEDESVSDLPSSLSRALEARSSDLRKQADTLTLPGVRRLLEKDLQLKPNHLDAHKLLVKQLVDKVMNGPAKEQPSTPDTSKKRKLEKSGINIEEDNVKAKKADIKVDKVDKAKGPTMKVEKPDIELKNLEKEKPKVESGKDGHELKKRLKVSENRDNSNKDDVPTKAGVEEGRDEDGARSEKKQGTEGLTSEDKVDMEALILNAVQQRSSEFRSQAESFTHYLVRRQLEQDLALNKGALDPYKQYIRKLVDELMSKEEEEAVIEKKAESPTMALGEEDEFVSDLPSSLSCALEARSSDLRKQADTLTLPGVRRLLEKDLQLKPHHLDAYRPSVRQLVDKVMDGPAKEQPSTPDTSKKHKLEKSGIGIEEDNVKAEKADIKVNKVDKAESPTIKIEKPDIELKNLEEEKPKVESGKDGQESKYRPPRQLQGRAAVGRPSYDDQWQWFAFVAFWILALAYGLEILSNELYVGAILITLTICMRRLRLPIFVVLGCTVFLPLISTTFGPIIKLVIRGLSSDWPWAEYLYVSSLRLILASLLLYGILYVKYFMPKVLFRYKMWKLLDFFLGTKWAIALSDHFREMMPSLAPCNPFLKDAVVSSTQESQFIARLLDWAPSMGQIPVQEFHEIEGTTLEPHACSYFFEIGSGQIYVDTQNRNNFKFESRARGRRLEEFVTITDWDHIATIFSILRYWEKSPDLGVIENLYVVDGDGIYCHCLSLQSIVEGVCKSREIFSLFKLSESRCFYVGSVSQQNKKEDKNSISFRQKLSSFFLTVLGFVSSYFVAVSKGSHVLAIFGLCIGLPLASFVFIDGCMSEFLFKLFVHWVLVHLCKESWRYRFYRWLKRKGCFLAFCDDFNPVLHHANKESELITLWNCTPGTSLARLVHGLDWEEIYVFAHMSSKWQWNGTRFVCSTVLPTTSLSTTVHSLFERELGLSGQDFEWHQGQRRYFELTLCGRTVRALSECHLKDSEAGGSEKVFWYTQLQFDDDPVEHLKWKESSYILFVYLMVKWKRRKFGVISGFRKFWFAKYYHVFSTYELARHIQENEEEDSNMPYSYYILIGEPKPTDMVA